MVGQRCMNFWNPQRNKLRQRDVSGIANHLYHEASVNTILLCSSDVNIEHETSYHRRYFVSHSCMQHHKLVKMRPSIGKPYIQRHPEQRNLSVLQSVHMQVFIVLYLGLRLVQTCSIERHWMEYKLGFNPRILLATNIYSILIGHVYRQLPKTSADKICQKPRVYRGLYYFR